MPRSQGGACVVEYSRTAQANPLSAQPAATETRVGGKKLWDLPLLQLRASRRVLTGLRHWCRWICKCQWDHITLCARNCAKPMCQSTATHCACHPYTGATRCARSWHADWLYFLRVHSGVLLDQSKSTDQVTPSRYPDHNMIPAGHNGWVVSLLTASPLLCTVCAFLMRLRECHTRAPAAVSVVVSWYIFCNSVRALWLCEPRSSVFQSLLSSAIIHDRRIRPPVWQACLSRVGRRWLRLVAVLWCRVGNDVM